MKFNSSKEKLNTLWRKSQVIHDKVVEQTLLKARVNDKLSHINNLKNTTQTYIDLSSGFQTLNPIIVNEGVPSTMWRQWEVEFSFLREDLIPYIRPKFVHKVGGATNEELDPLTAVTDKHIIQVTDISGSSQFKKVRVESTFALRNNAGVQENVEVKLLLMIYNPTLYYNS